MVLRYWTSTNIRFEPQLTELVVPAASSPQILSTIRNPVLAPRRRASASGQMTYFQADSGTEAGPACVPLIVFLAPAPLYRLTLFPAKNNISRRRLFSSKTLGSTVRTGGRQGPRLLAVSVGKRCAQGDFVGENNLLKGSGSIRRHLASRWRPASLIEFLFGVEDQLNENKLKLHPPPGPDLWNLPKRASTPHLRRSASSILVRIHAPLSRRDICNSPHFHRRLTGAGRFKSNNISRSPLEQKKGRDRSSHYGAYP
jgi:hypothetical protein